MTAGVLGAIGHPAPNPVVEVLHPERGSVWLLPGSYSYEFLLKESLSLNKFKPVYFCLMFGRAPNNMHIDGFPGTTATRNSFNVKLFKGLYLSTTKAVFNLDKPFSGFGLVGICVPLRKKNVFLDLVWFKHQAWRN